MEGLNASRFPVFVMTGGILYVNLSWDRGTDITFNLTYYADDIPSNPEVSWNWLEAGHVTSFMAHNLLLNWTYTAYGNYSIHLSIGNNIAVQERWLVGYIEPDLKDVMLVDVEYVPSASPLDIEIRMRVFEPNETFPFYTWCRIDAGDGSDPVMFSMISESAKHHTYLTDAANASLDVLCHNQVSSVSLNEEILLRTNISNLTVAAVTKVCAVSTECAFVITMDSGSHINYIINATDRSGSVHYRDPTRVASSSSFNFTHVYMAPNNYSLRVYAYNEHFQAEAVLVYPIIVQVVLPELKLEGKDVVVIPDGSTEFVLRGTSTGKPPSQVFCTWNFRTSDTETYYSTEIMQKRPEKVTFTYDRSDIGEPIIIHVDCYNLVSRGNASFVSRVEETLEVLNILPFVKHGIPDTEMGIQLTLSAGSHVQFRVDYGDGTVDTIDHPQLFADSEPVDTLHPYNATGNYTVNVFASNLVNTVRELSDELVIQNPVVNLSLSANTSVLWPPGKVDYLLEADQNQKELNDLHCVWHFDVSEEEYSYVKSLTQGNPYQSQHIFPGSAIGNATIKVNCSNLVSWQETETVVEIVFDEVILGSLETDGSVLWSNVTVLTLKIKRFGTYSCFRWDLGDGREIFYGVQSMVCQKYASTNSLYLNEIPFGQPSIAVSHTYPDLGDYIASVFAFNHVSNDTLQVTADIDDWPCEKPEVSFPSDYVLPLTIMRSEPLNFLANVTVNCTKTTVFKVTLEVFRKSDQHLAGNLSTFESHQVTFSPRTFEYGRYDLRYTVALVLSHPILNVDGMQTTAEFELEVTKTPLVVGIVNGEHHGSYWNRSVIMNAENMTYDPDYPDDADSLQYTWFCRLATEQFPMGVGQNISRDPPTPHSGSLIDTILGYGGCFGDGPGVLPYPSGEFRLDTESMSVHTAYVLRVEVNKDDRMGYSEQNYLVGPADPPVMTIV